ncbi:hypothetical protein HPB50_019193 [Hyalomma asiaticum]|uniref:Uncharacterized protein n=1 Tax=Hyalomma asiaticum TaxID=266040 RepID=A0ACB7S776_HYAAI|nr:hypothetical protein HPB50_019193 [Hyalomma asiaticum]
MWVTFFLDNHDDSVGLNKYQVVDEAAFELPEYITTEQLKMMPHPWDARGFKTRPGVSETPRTGHLYDNRSLIVEVTSACRSRHSPVSEPTQLTDVGADIGHTMTTEEKHWKD